jgi:hypothetical protein
MRHFKSCKVNFSSGIAWIFLFLLDKVHYNGLLELQVVLIPLVEFYPHNYIARNCIPNLQDVEIKRI